jgi:TonB family protein
MLRRTLLFFSAMAMAAAPARGVADALQPTRGWVVDYRDDQCLATRDYGSADKPLTLGVRPSPNGETYELMVARPHSGPDFANEQKGAVNFGRGKIKSWLLNYGGKSTRSDIYQFRISAAEMQQARSAPTVTLSTESAAAFTFQLASMPALLKTLEDCTMDLKRYWNMGAGNEQLVAAASKGDLRGIFSADDYPQEALYRGQGGDSVFLLLIDEKGNVAGCHVLEPSGVPALDAMGCQVIRKRAKFVPATDAQGKPIRSTVTTPKISWRMY